MNAQQENGTPLHVGQRFESTSCSTNVVVLDPGSAGEAPSCGGARMKPGAVIRCSERVRPGPRPARTVAGSIYWDETTGMKLRCTRSGSGVLSLQGRTMLALPSATDHAARQEARRWHEARIA
jgi:hypothetical protein